MSYLQSRPRADMLSIIKTLLQVGFAGGVPVPPEKRFLISMTGYPPETGAVHGIDDSEIAVLPKPFSQDFPKIE